MQYSFCSVKTTDRVTEVSSLHTLPHCQFISKKIYYYLLFQRNEIFNSSGAKCGSKRLLRHTTHIVKMSRMYYPAIYIDTLKYIFLLKYWIASIIVDFLPLIPSWRKNIRQSSLACDSNNLWERFQKKLKVLRHFSHFQGIKPHKNVLSY